MPVHQDDLDAIGEVLPEAGLLAGEIISSWCRLPMDDGKRHEGLDELVRAQPNDPRTRRCLQAHPKARDMLTRPSGG